MNLEDIQNVQNIGFEKERLISLIDFAQQAARLSAKAVAQVEQHGLFKLYEHELLDLPGIRLNLSTIESEDERWMSISRLQETRPPEIIDAALLPWVEIVNSTTIDPKLRTMVGGEALIAAGTHRASGELIFKESKIPEIDRQALVMLAEYELADKVKAGFQVYVNESWKAWAEEEKRRRKTIRLYGQLFTLQQQLQEGVVDSPMEIAWGVGMGDLGM